MHVSGWHDGLGGKSISARAGRLEFDPQNPCGKEGRAKKTDEFPAPTSGRSRGSDSLSLGHPHLCTNKGIYILFCLHIKKLMWWPTCVIAELLSWEAETGQLPEAWSTQMLREPLPQCLNVAEGENGPVVL